MLLQLPLRVIPFEEKVLYTRPIADPMIIMITDLSIILVSFGLWGIDLYVLGGDYLPENRDADSGNFGTFKIKSQGGMKTS